MKKCNLNNISASPSKLLVLLFTFLAVSLQVLNVYASGIPSIAFGEILLIVSMPILLVDKIRHNGFLRIHLYYFFYFFCIVSTLLVTMINPTFDIMEAVKRLLRDGLYISIFLFWADDYFDYRLGWKLYRYIVILLSSFIMLQTIVFYLTKIELSGFFLQAKLGNGYIGYDLQAHYSSLVRYSGYIRPNGFLLEPAHCAKYLLPALVMCLIPLPNEKPQYGLAVFITVAMCMTLSTNAFAFVGFAWLLWFVMYYIWRMTKKTAICLLVAMGFLACCSTMMFIGSAAVREQMLRLFTIGSGQTVNSASLRVLRGIAFFFATPFAYKWFGIGFGNFDSFKETYAVSTPFEAGGEYMNTDAYILTSAGVFGFIFFLVSLFFLCYKKPLRASALALSMLFVGLAGSIYSTGIITVMFLFMIYVPKGGQDENIQSISSGL